MPDPDARPAQWLPDSEGTEHWVPAPQENNNMIVGVAVCGVIASERDRHGWCPTCTTKHRTEPGR